MVLIDEIEKAWGWTGLKPAKVLGDNDFGNLMIKDSAGGYWRLCPEELYCVRVADNRVEFDAFTQGQDFLHDWYLEALVQQARDNLGLLRPGYKYCLKIPAVLGGKYEVSNLAIISLQELVAVSGHIAEEIDGLPDGAQIRLSVVD